MTIGLGLGMSLSTRSEQATAIFPTSVAGASIDIHHTGDFNVGVNGVYTVDFENVSASSTNAPTLVTVSLPASLTYVSASGSGWSFLLSGARLVATHAANIAASVTKSFTVTVTPTEEAVVTTAVTAEAHYAVGDSVATDDDLTTVVTGPPPITYTAKGTASGYDVLAGLTDITLSNVSLLAGSTLVVCLVTDILDGINVSWNGIGLTQAAFQDAPNAATKIFFLPNVVAGTADVLAETAGDPGRTISMTAAQVAGIVVLPSDVSAQDLGTSTSPNSGDTATTAQANEILIGAIGTAGPSSDTAGSWSGSFTNGQRIGTSEALFNATISEGYRIVGATGAYSAAKTGITSRVWAACIATFKGN